MTFLGSYGGRNLYRQHFQMSNPLLNCSIQPRQVCTIHHNCFCEVGSRDSYLFSANRCVGLFPSIPPYPFLQFNHPYFHLVSTLPSSLSPLYTSGNTLCFLTMLKPSLSPSLSLNGQILCSRGLRFGKTK